MRRGRREEADQPYQRACSERNADELATVQGRGHADREHDELRQHRRRPRPPPDAGKSANHEAKTDRANRRHDDDGPQITRIERSMP